MMLDELRNLFLRALKCDDGITAIALINEWNEAVKQVQDVFDNITSKVSKPIKTNADEIRQMSDEELADYLRWHNDLYSRNGMDWLDWLKQENE